MIESLCIQKTPYSCGIKKRRWEGLSTNVEFSVGVARYIHQNAFIETKTAQYSSEINCLMDEDVSAGLETKDVKSDVKVGV